MPSSAAADAPPLIRSTATAPGAAPCSSWHPCAPCALHATRCASWAAAARRGGAMGVAWQPLGEGSDAVER
eukprot:CAMPEP_0173449186 /NCGR_PEP_ID=MMETSP1357-20121228/42301_1 /TAXON_ID=77926 /ORGANISM="Hemiselmis rufescens, Strain PCC563" /LENGTH=70 /DNA_ID=CAMNT_0014415759 /DNA_START=32 /DNA_END=241 /DNA_ORIENTATION=-